MNQLFDVLFPDLLCLSFLDKYSAPSDHIVAHDSKIDSNNSQDNICDGSSNTVLDVYICEPSKAEQMIIIHHNDYFVQTD